MSDNLNENETIKLQKFTFEYMNQLGDDLIFSCQSKRDGLSRIDLPFNFNKITPERVDITMELSQGKPERIEIWDYFKFLAQGSAVDIDEEIKKVYTSKKHHSLVLRNLPEEYFREVENDEQDFPRLTYSDITEKDMFGEEEITAANLLANGGSGGIWGYHGLRKLELIVKGLPNMPQLGDTDFKERGNLYWYKRDSTDINPVYETDIRYQKAKNCDEEENSDERRYIAYINTNVLGDLAARADSNHPEFSGRFELLHEYMDEIITYSFPVKICVHDTTIDAKGKNHLLEKNRVSIDFGTSSTCAAVKGTGRPRLFTLSGRDKRQDTDDNPYENPTNLMIYDWDAVYRQWQMENDNCPFVLTKSAEHDEQEADYDSGYTVDDEYRDVDDERGRRKMAAILTQLKLIPYLESYGKETKFTPYGGKERTAVRVTDSIAPDDNTDKKFNPIAFYGYLLSRAINRPQENRFYQNYDITYPVKFDETVREKIRASLEYGIKRALPKTLRDAKNNKGESLVAVKMRYAEPVACVGAFVGRQLKISADDQKAKLFAVYDLGGGTLDFAFGIFRPARDEELEKADQVIDLLGVGGDDKVGGEKLIHKLAYKIYCDSKESMEEEKIKFILPQGILPPQGFEGLLKKNGDEISDANVNLIKENLARYLFMENESVDNKLTNIKQLEGKVKDANTCEMTLRNKEGEDVKVTLNVKGIDEFLNDEIQATIDSFKKEMKQSFDSHIDRLNACGIQNFNKNEVFIFLGGNASKQHYVKEIMEQVFGKERIYRIGDDSDGVVEQQEAGEQDNFKTIGDMFRLNEKTAVAFGQLNLGSYLVLDDAIRDKKKPPFLFNVGYKDSGTGEYVPVLQKNDISREWKKANRLDRESLMTNLIYTTDPQCRLDTMKTLEEDVSDAVDEDQGITLYIRICDEDSIEYRVGANNAEFLADEKTDPDMVLKLNVLDN